MSVDALLKVLADGGFHSGQDLAASQGVSRTAIWKQVTALASLGLEVERRRGLGYRIPGGLDLLDRGAIYGALDPGVAERVHELQLHREIDSTNRVLSDAEPARGGLARVALAERQTSGRGRRGKLWLSPFAHNIYLSFDWQFSGGVQELEGLSLAVGVAVCEALAALGVGGLQLKWPNDVLHDGRKIGGILIELTGDAEGPCRAIIGIGINVAMPEEVAQSIDQPWTDLARAYGGEVPPRSAIAAALINHCLPLLAGYGNAGFAPWRSRWLALDAFAGAPVVVTRGAAKSAGIARGVDERGALLLETAQGVTALAGGELSLRGR